MCAIAGLAALSSSAMFAVSLGVSAVTTGIQYMAQKAQAEAQVEAQETNLKNTADAANAAMVQSVEDLQQRTLQTRAATALRVSNAETRTLQAKGTFNAANEASGLSVAALMDDYDRQFEDYADAQYRQLGFDIDQIDRQVEGVQAQAKSRVNSVPIAPVSGPSLGGALADFGATAVGAFNQYSVRDPLTGNRTLT
jgi:hypothetical protein